MEHNLSKVFSTKGRGPFELIYYEACMDKKDAYAREQFLKSGPGKRYLKNRMKRFLSLTGQATQNKNAGFTPLEVQRPRRLLAHQRAGLLTGFTLIEMVIIIGLLGLLAAFGLFISMDVYRGNSFHSEKNIIISILQKARSQAVNNINEKKHGVHFEPGKYTIFEGDTYTPGVPTNQQITAGNNITNSGVTDVVFDQLTGSTGGTYNLTVTGQAFSRIITINPEGRISW